MRVVAADVERELEQLVGAFDVLGFDDLRDAQIDLVEVVDGDRCRLLVLLAAGWAAVIVDSLLDFEQRVELLCFNSRHEVLVVS